MTQLSAFRVSALIALGAASLLAAPRYTAQQTVEQGLPVVHLTDSVRGVEVSILPSVGNRAYEMKVHGKNILYFPVTDMAEFMKRPGLNGIPFLAPWANRIDDTGFWANDKKYEFDPGLGNVSKTMPMHGLLGSSPLWKVAEAKADEQSAWVTSRLEFWKYPALIAQWPFAHEYEMTYLLKDGVLEVRTTVINLSTEAMPVSFGFHPYFRIPDVPRDEWTAQLPPGGKAVVADERRIPSGELKPMDLPNPMPLKGRTLDDGYTALGRDAQGRAHFAIEAGGKKVDVVFGPKFQVAVIWEPAAPAGQTRDFICFEPMTAITNGVNLAHAGKYADLQSVPAGGKFTESFWVSASGL